MKNLNAEQVTKALGCCVIGDCEPCAYRSFVGCRDSMCGDALALITSQEQRIKELAEEYLYSDIPMIVDDPVIKVGE